MRCKTKARSGRKFGMTSRGFIGPKLVREARNDETSYMKERNVYTKVP